MARNTQWSRERHELFFQGPDTAKIMVAPYVVDGDSFRADKPRLWSPASYQPEGWLRVYDVHPDGKRVAIAKPLDTAADKRDKVVIILNFFDELRRLAPPVKK